MTLGFSHLLATAKQLRFEPHDIRAQLDQTGRYDLRLGADFPLAIKLFHYTSRTYTRGLTWHEQLELFLPLDGPARFRMGEDEVSLGRGDLLVVDNRKLHCVVDFPQFNTRAIVISFMPEFAYTLGSPSSDYAFLIPFHTKVEAQPHVLRAKDALAPAVYTALSRLLECYYLPADKNYLHAGCKVYLLEMLYFLARRFHGSVTVKAEFLRQQQRTQRLKKLLDHISEHSSDKITVADASRLANMSQASFMKIFKRVAGMSFVAYMTRLRLARSLPLLRETDLTIAEVSGQVGFGEQSYFDRRFKKQFGITPLQFRNHPTQDNLPPGTL